MEEENSPEFPAQSCHFNCLDSNLWLGNLAAASNVELLKEKNVKHILTVNSFPLPKKIRNLGFVENKYIEVYDTPEDDLLSHFEHAYEFIESGLQKGVVLVHCYFGMSRSATVIISYYMKKNKTTLDEAFRYVKSKCESIAPNSGFLDQLKLYEIMGCTLNEKNIQYKIFRLCMTSHSMRKGNVIPELYADVIQNDPIEFLTTDEDPVVYKCRKCRRILARGSNEIPHASGGTFDWRNSGNSDEREICGLTYFMEPFVWMKNIKVSLEGKIHCPNRNCNNKLGAFNWVSGIQCLCGTNVRPGFYLVPSKIDKQKKS